MPQTSENQRPNLNEIKDGTTLRSFYYLKEELVQFCRKNGLPTSGGKVELTNRIAHYLDTKEIMKPSRVNHAKPEVSKITDESVIEENFVCSQMHREYFKNKIGKSFSFCVPFQKWLKSNAGKTYEQAVEAYIEIKKKKKSERTSIDHQFEYNTYIRDFFADNHGFTLADAIQCWNYKKNQQGHHRYEKADLKTIQENICSSVERNKKDSVESVQQDMGKSDIEIRKLQAGEVKEALALVWKVFQKFEAPDYTKQGMDTFYNSIHDSEYLKLLCIYAAFKNNKMVGVIATRCEGSHIALFFVEGALHRMGIGRKLFDTVCANSNKKRITVNASPYALEVYHHLGFVETKEEQLTDGLRYTPMECMLK